MTIKAVAILIGSIILGGAVGVWSINLPNAQTSAQGGDCGYYTNSAGHQVPRPCGNWRTDRSGPPQGATALCRDGTYSFSEHPYYSGTCSHHGGAAEHLR